MSDTNAGTVLSPAAAQVVVARQPITDRLGAVVGFELLYRPRRVDAPRASGDQMTADVVLGALTIGIDQLVGSKVMFCNAERGVLTGETPLTLPAMRTVIEVLETVAVDDQVVAGCRDLVAAGFRLALDDFVWCEGAERLLELASIVKVDLLATSREDILDLMRRCRPYDVLLLAEKVETDDDVAWAMENGFDLFQGYAIERPALVHGQMVAASTLAHVQLATTMLADELEFDELEAILRREPGLVVQLLQMAAVGNHQGMRREVRSVRDALVLMGTARIRQWVALTIFGSQPSPSPDGLATSLVRARMVELLAVARGVDAPAFAFTAGLLSSLDLMLGASLDQLASTMDIDDSLKAAAFHREGPVGDLVTAAARYQSDLERGIAPEDPDGDLDDVAAAAFAWAMPYVNSVRLTEG